MHLGKLVWPDKKNLQDYHKVSMCNSVNILPDSNSFLLLGHKADHFFEGNLVIVGEMLLLTTLTTPSSDISPHEISSSPNTQSFGYERMVA